MVISCCLKRLKAALVSSTKSIALLGGSMRSTAKLDNRELEKEIRRIASEVGVAAVLRVLADIHAEQLETRDDPTKVGWCPEYGWLNVTDSVFGRWIDKYPSVRVRVELAAAHEWLLDKPSKRKKHYHRFIESWLARSQKSSRAYNGGYKEVEGGGF